MSYFNGVAVPHKILCVGRPHNTVAQSFHVKILNQVFFLLKQKGIEVEIPASEIMYRLFWKNLTFETKKIEFWLMDKKDLDQFPSYFKLSNIFNLNSPIPSCFNFPLHSYIIKNSAVNINQSLYNTQFEDYVHCPHKFYLKNILNIKKNEENNTVEFKEIGIKMHKICEQFITRFVTLFGNENYLINMPEILNKLIKIL